MEFKALNKNISRHYGHWRLNLALAFISEVGLTDQWHKIFNMNYPHYMPSAGYTSSPIVLQWAVKQGLSAPAANNSGKCPVDVLSRLCKSEHSDCWQENGMEALHATAPRATTATLMSPMDAKVTTDFTRVHIPPQA
jgi:hypothetical protein